MLVQKQHYHFAGYLFLSLFLPLISAFEGLMGVHTSRYLRINVCRTCKQTVTYIFFALSSAISLFKLCCFKTCRPSLFWQECRGSRIHRNESSSGGWIFRMAWHSIQSLLPGFPATPRSQAQWPDWQWNIHFHPSLSWAPTKYWDLWPQPLRHFSTPTHWL